ncbi:hypothetical protein [Nocardia pseudobrasiliensis]|uniref:hypothetical protein n=1 Tax=Nocardia pseudobrasiliensis TaxID=45979 RepID=UPI0014710F02|nr:hypothetical protein [Nocardia pseudobrasiliensis]
MADQQRRVLGNGELYELIQVGERVAHAQASSVDAAAAAHGRSVVTPHAVVVIADSGVAGSKCLLPARGGDRAAAGVPNDRAASGHRGR